MSHVNMSACWRSWGHQVCYQHDYVQNPSSHCVLSMCMCERSIFVLWCATWHLAVLDLILDVNHIWLWYIPSCSWLYILNSSSFSNFFFLFYFFLLEVEYTFITDKFSFSPTIFESLVLVYSNCDWRHVLFLLWLLKIILNISQYDLTTKITSTSNF